MFTIVCVIIGIYLFIQISSLKTSLKILESEVSDLKKGSVRSPLVAPETNPVPTAIPEPLQENRLSYSVPEQIRTTETPPKITQAIPSESRITEWFKENLLLKIGVLMILLGFGWFVSYAFIHNWIGPVGRITLGFIIGTLVTLFGTTRLGKNETQGIACTILGSALIIMTALAGQYYYQFFSSVAVLGIVFIISIYISVSAIAYGLEKLVVYGLLVSLFAPYFSHTSSMDPVVLYLYLGVVSASTIWISVSKGWKTVTATGITGVLFYSLVIFVDKSYVHLDTKYLVLFVAYVISVLYLVTSVWSLIRNKEDVQTQDVYITIVNTVLILGFTLQIVPTIYQSLTVSAWMLMYAFSGFYVFYKTQSEKLFYIHSLVSILLLAIATSIELRGPTLVIAFAIEAGIISVASYVITNKIKTAEIFGLLMFVPCMLSLTSFNSPLWQTAVFHSDFAVLAVTGLVLAALGVLYQQHKDQTTGTLKAYHIAYIVSTVYAYALIWLSVDSLLYNSDTAVFISLFIFTVIGLATHFTGLFHQNIILKKYGMGLLIIVVARLILVDVWNMELVIRVITFIVLGVLFMSTAFISKKQVGQHTIIS